MTVAAKNIAGRVNNYTLSSTGVTDWIPLEIRKNPWECTFQIAGDAAAIAGTLDATLEFVISDDPDNAEPECINQHAALVNVTDCENDKLEYPASHVRMNVATLSAGNAILSILQPGTA